MERVVLRHLDPKSIIHPDDDAVVRRLDGINGFRTLLTNTVVRLSEMWNGVNYTGSGFRISEESSPKLYGQMVDDCKILNISSVPAFSALWEPFISSQPVGETNPRVIITSGSVDLLTPEELDFLIGHELGHFICGHMPYQMLLETLYSPILAENDTLGIANIIKLPLLEWLRASHFTSDRVGLLCCQDIKVALSAMIKMAGVPKKYYDSINVESFINQANEFSVFFNDPANKLMKNMIIRAADSPWMVMRAKQLMDWYESGEYQSIIDRG